MDEAVLLKQALLEKTVLFAIKLLRKKDVLGKTLLHLWETSSERIDMLKLNFLERQTFLQVTWNNSFT